MGERAPEPAPVPPRRRGWAPRILLAVSLAVAVWAALPRSTWDALEVTTWLQAESLVGDFDWRWDREDRIRFEEWGRRNREVLLPEPLVVPGKAGDRFDAPLIPSLLLTPAALIGGPGTGLVWQILLLGAALSLVLQTSGPRSGGVTPGLLALLVLGSAAFPNLFHLWPDVLLLGLVVTGLALAWRRPGSESSEELPDVWEGPWGESPGRFLLRWSSAGLCLGMAATARPFLLPLLLPLLVPVPRDRRVTARWLAGGTFALPLVVSLGWDLLRGSFTVPALPELDPNLWLWAGLDLVAGRHLGLIPYFLPMILILVLWSGEEGRWSLGVAGLLGLAALVVWRPFDLAGNPWTFGNRVFLGLYPVFWFAVGRAPRIATLVGFGAVAGALVWPMWLGPGTVPDPHEPPGRWVAPYLRPWLPVETTQRALIDRIPKVRSGGVDAFLLSPRARRGDETGEIWITGSESVELLLRSPNPVVGLRLEASELAGAELALRGAELSQTVFRPDGSSGFRITFEGEGRTHPTERGGPAAHFRRFRARWPHAPARPVRVAVGGLETAIPDMEE
ncbi:MAG: hypothetical protein R3234_02280 [Thermoanaerobaculia bacterium]|nr:hypothetical protein [Thermoanaerobaculia bacterium]